MRKQGLSPCFVNAHLNDEDNKPNALNLSIEVTKQILCNLKLKTTEINELFEKYINN